jgi:aspartate aminotransferase
MPEITEHVERSRRLHARVAAGVHAELVDAGVSCRPPQAGFYLYPDFSAHRARLAARGITSSIDLSRALLDEHGIATLPGSAFGDSDDALTLRLATSLLYGSTAGQRQTSLSSEMPEELPWIIDAIEQIRAALNNLTSEAIESSPGARRNAGVAAQEK